jgi:hypothetical protein
MSVLDVLPAVQLYNDDFEAPRDDASAMEELIRQVRDSTDSHL